MQYPKIVILSGAGISAESGIPVFRSETGLWENHAVEDVATYEGFERNPGLVHDFYSRMRLGLPGHQPNPAHLALTKLQRIWAERGGEVCIVTQNIDDLHERAGSLNVLHMHGELLKLRCEACGRSFAFSKASTPDTLCPYCGKAATRPDIVWFGEMPYYLDEIGLKLSKCDLFISIGTSGVVYPAAGFCQIARAAGALCVEVNLTPSLTASNFQMAYYGKAGSVIPKLVSSLISEGQLPAEALP